MYYGTFMAMRLDSVCLGAVVNDRFILRCCFVCCFRVVWPAACSLVRR